MNFVNLSRISRVVLKMLSIIFCITFQHFSFDGILIYHCSSDGDLVFDRKIDLEQCVIDFDFVGRYLVALLATKEDFVAVLDIEGNEKYSKTQSELVAKLQAFFEGIGENYEPQNLDGYYKRWFDNVNSYQENKEKRIRESSSNGNGISPTKKICTDLNTTQ